MAAYASLYLTHYGTPAAPSGTPVVVPGTVTVRPPKLRFVAAHLMTGEVIGDLKVDSFSWGPDAGGNGGWTASLPWNRTALALTTGGVGVWVTAGDQVLFGGRALRYSATIDDNGIRGFDLRGSTFLQPFTKRYLTSLLGVGHGYLATEDDGTVVGVEWPEGTDIFDVVGDVLSHTTIVQPDALLPMDLVYGGTAAGGYSGVTLPAPYRVAINTTIASILSDLVDNFGLLIRWSYRWSASNHLRATLNLLTAGVDTEIALVLGKQVGLVSYDQDAEDRVDLVKFLDTSAQAASLRYPDGPYPQEEALVSSPVDGEDINLLAARAASELRASPSETLVVEIGDLLNPRRAHRLGEWDVLDTVVVDAVDGPVDAQGRWRIVAYSVSAEYGDKTALTARLTLNPADTGRPVLEPGARMLNRLRQLR